MRVCSSCKKQFDEPHQYKTCNYCRDINHRWRAAHREGHCPTCHKPWSSDKFRTCDTCREYRRKWCKRSRVIIRAARSRYRKKHPEDKLKIAKRGRRYRQANPEKLKIHKHNRRARVKGNGGTYTIKERNALFDKQNGICPYCGKPLYAKLNDPVSIDHKIPIVRGGTNDISNIALAHTSCNKKKHTRTHEEYLEFLANNTTSPNFR